MNKKRAGRPPESGEKKLLLGIYLNADQLNWLRKQDRPMSAVIRELIAEKMGESK